MIKDINRSSDNSPPCGIFIFFGSHTKPFKMNKRATLFNFIQQQKLILNSIHRIQTKKVIFKSVIAILMLSKISNAQVAFDTAQVVSMINSCNYIFEGEIIDKCSFQDPSNRMIYTVYNIQYTND